MTNNKSDNSIVEFLKKQHPQEENIETKTDNQTQYKNIIPKLNGFETFDYAMGTVAKPLGFTLVVIGAISHDFETAASGFLALYSSKILMDSAYRSYYSRRDEK